MKKITDSQRESMAAALFRASELTKAQELATSALALARDAIETVPRAVKAAISERSGRGGTAKRAKDKDGKQTAIAASRLLWEERNSGKHTRLRTEDQFAAEVERRWPVLSSHSATKKRSTKWRKEAVAKTTK